jgi:excinuclease ABC subunit B
MYADELTDSMEKAIKETNRRRKIQMAYNEEHGIVPQTIKKDIFDDIRATIMEEDIDGEKVEIKTEEDIDTLINKLTDEMLGYAQRMEFEEAAKVRDRIKELEVLKIKI